MQSTRILFISSNPKDSPTLNLAHEIRDIKNSIISTTKRDELIFSFLPSARISDFMSQMIREKPTILHFSGHGRTEGIILEDDSAYSQILDTKTIEELFKLCSSFVKCVILNACYSKEQALVINKYIPYVIGISNTIIDSSAKVFSISFYEALGNNDIVDYAFAYKYAKIRTSIEDKDGSKNITLFENPKYNYLKDNYVLENRNINGTWFGRYKSIDQDKTEFTGEIALIIHQNKDSIEIISRTDKFMAYSFSESFIYNPKSKNNQLIYLYSQNGFDIFDDATRKGTSELELFFESNAQNLQGDFWTNSPSKGKLSVKKITNKHLKSFSEAKRLSDKNK